VLAEANAAAATHLRYLASKAVARVRVALEAAAARIGEDAWARAFPRKEPWTEGAWPILRQSIPERHALLARELLALDRKITRRYTGTRTSIGADSRCAVRFTTPSGRGRACVQQGAVGHASAARPQP
jgi:hypothetical protein